MGGLPSPTENESVHMAAIAGRLDSLERFLTSSSRPGLSAAPHEWFLYLAGIKAIQGNFSNDLSFVSAMMAKGFLCAKLDMEAFDVSSKAQGAPGLDIDERTRDGKRVIAEIKTTTPYGPKELGAQQKVMFQKDFLKLAENEADHKFFFVTDERSFDVVVRKYAVHLPGTTVVLLPAGKEFQA